MAAKRTAAYMINPPAIITRAQHHGTTGVAHCHGAYMRLDVFLLQSARLKHLGNLVRNSARYLSRDDQYVLEHQSNGGLITFKKIACLS